MTPRPKARADKDATEIAEPARLDGERRARDYSQTAFDVVRKATERHEHDEADDE